MGKYILLLAVILVLSAWIVLTPGAAHAEFQLPNYASGANVDSELQSKGKKITSTIALVVGIIAILGMLIGAGYMGAGNADKGKQYLLGGVISIVLASVVFGIASLVA